MTLKARLLVGLAFVAVVLGVAAVVVTRTTRDHLMDQVDQQLLSATSPGRDRGNRPPSNDDRDDDDDDGRPSTLLYAELYDDGTLKLRLVPNLDDADDLPNVTARELLDAETGEPFTVEGDAHDWRVVVTEGPFHRNVAAVSLDDVDETVRRMVVVELIAVGAVLGSLALVGWWVIRLGVRPIKQMTAVAADIAAGDLSHRVPNVKESTEAGQLGVALNQMLGTIEAAFDERTRSEDRLKQFVHDASHELRTPIATVRGYAELYRRGGLPAGPDLDDAMRRTEQEAIRMGGLVDDLLHLARLDQGRPLERLPVVLDRLVADAVADARAVQPERTITAEIAEAMTVIGDEARLRQVIANLVSNARVHTPASSAIEVALRREGTMAVVEVRDRGPGMPPEVAARAFERFYRADQSRARHAGGSGLGLAIVKATVEAHGGTVTLESSVEAGTVVRVRLPVGPPGPLPPPAPPAPPAPLPSPATSG